MVSDKILIRKKWRKLKLITKIFIIILALALIALILYFAGFLTNKSPIINQQRIVLEHPLKNIVFANTNEEGLVDKEKVIEQALQEFNVDYINYILVALGVNGLSRSKLGYGNPMVEFIIDDETWSSEIIKGGLNTKKEAIEGEDIIFRMSKQELVESLLASNINDFVIDSVRSGKTGIELIASKPELFSKGYLGMYKDLTGKEIEE